MMIDMETNLGRALDLVLGVLRSLDVEAREVVLVAVCRLLDIPCRFTREHYRQDAVSFRSEGLNLLDDFKPVRELIREVEEIAESFNAMHGKQMQSKKMSDRLKALAQKYLMEVRPSSCSDSSEEAFFVGLDRLMNELSTLCQRPSSIAKYKEVLLELRWYLWMVGYRA